MKQLMTLLPKKSGRASGKITVRHQGGRHKRFLREIDFRRNKHEVWGKVEAIEYDPNRNADLAKICYTDGERRYILAPHGLKVGDRIIASANAPLNPGNALPIKKIPAGTTVHNLEITPGKGGQIAKGAGASAIIQGREESFILIKLPSSEVKRFDPDATATIGQVGKIEMKALKLGKAGRKRRMGIRPTVRGTAMHPGAHPHGGGEGRSGVGLKYPKTPYGKPAVGKTRTRRKYSDKMVVTKRKSGKHGAK